MTERIKTITYDEYKVAREKMNKLFDQLATNISGPITPESLRERNNIRKEIDILEKNYPSHQTIVKNIPIEDLISKSKEQEEFNKQQEFKHRKLIEERQKRFLVAMDSWSSSGGFYKIEEFLRKQEHTAVNYLVYLSFVSACRKK